MSKINNAMKMDISLRKEKDRQKAILSETSPRKIDFIGVVTPRILHQPSMLDRAMPWYFNGYLLSFKDGIMVVDPGVDFYSRFTTTSYTVKDIRAIFVSHQHLDHCGDLLVFLDIINRTKTSIDLILPINVIDGILPIYYQKLVRENELINLVILQDNSKNVVDLKWPILADFKPIQHNHSVGHTFGFRLTIGDKKIVYISDTGYSTLIRTSCGDMLPSESDGTFESIVNKNLELKKAVNGATTLICNLNDLSYNRHSLKHLSGWDLADIIKDNNIKQLILQHVSPYDINGDSSNDMYLDFFHDLCDYCAIFDGNEQKILFA